MEKEITLGIQKRNMLKTEVYSDYLLYIKINND